MLRYGEDRAHIDLSRPYIIGIQGAAISNTGLSQKRSSPLLAKNGYDRKPAADFDHLDYLASVDLPDRQHRRSPCQRPLSILVSRMTDLNIFPIRISMIKISRLSMIVGGLTFLVTTLTPVTRIIVYAGETFYNGGAGATGVRELPLFVAKDFKIFEKYGLDVELISTNGGSPLVQALVGGQYAIGKSCCRRRVPE
jgi:hypothetical protein